jgi:heme A synthase
VALVIAIVIVAVVVLAALAWRRRRAPDDGVANFQRQIDALSRDARKPTIEQLRHSDEDDAVPPDTDGDHDGS